MYMYLNFVVFHGCGQIVLFKKNMRKCDTFPMFKNFDCILEF